MSASLLHRPRHRPRLRGRCLLPLCVATTALGDELLLEPVADTTIYEDAPDAGTGASDFLFAGPVASGSPRRALLRFDLGALPPQAEVIAVSLRLSVNRAAAGASLDDAYTVHRLLASWGEGGGDGGTGGAGGAATATDATWMRRFHGAPPGAPGPAWALPGGDFAAPGTNFTLGGVGAYTLASTPALVADVRQWQADPAANFGWLVQGPEGPDFSQKARRLISRSSPSIADRPRLTIVYALPGSGSTTTRQVPLPAFAPLALAVLCLAAVRHQHRRT